MCYKFRRFCDIAPGPEKSIQDNEVAVDGDSVGVIQKNVALSPKPLRKVIDCLDQLYQTPSPFRMVISYREKMETPVGEQKVPGKLSFRCL